MFGFGKKKESQPPPFRPSPFVNDGNPIHQAIIGIKNGDTTQVKLLFDALEKTPVIFPMAEAGNLKTGAALEFEGAAHLAVYTRREFITNVNAGEYPYIEEVLLPKVCMELDM